METLILILLLAPTVLWAASPSIEEFKRMHLKEQRRAVEQAPPEMKQALKTIFEHHRRVLQYGGEAGFRAEKECRVIAARGLDDLFRVFNEQASLWGVYFGCVVMAAESAGMSPEKQLEITNKLTKEIDVVNKRVDLARSTVLNVAPTVEAMALAKRAKVLEDSLMELSRSGGATSGHPLTRDQLMTAERQVDEIFSESKKLPTLPPEKVQKEYDAYPEDQMPEIRGVIIDE